MKTGTKTALGIEISETLINMALLEKGKDGVQLVRAASTPVPAGAIKNGSIEDAEILSKAIKELKARNKIRARQVAVSLLARPVVAQIIEIPKQVPTNIGQFVQNEGKRCVALSGMDVALDFCRVSSGPVAGKRLFMVATDGQKVAELVKTCIRARLKVKVIEPPLLAYARAFYDKKIAGKFDCNVLMVTLQNNTLTLSVFRKQTLDFVRTKNVSEEKPEEICQQIAEQINAIVRFYDFEVADSAKKWEVTVVTDGVGLSKDAEESLRAKVANVALEVTTAENAWQYTPIAGSRDIGTEKPSPVAVGLALRLLNIDAGNLKINFWTPESAEVRSVKKQLLVAANIVAAILVIMKVTSGGLALWAERVNQRIDYKKQTELPEATNTLLREQDRLDRQIKQLSDRPNHLSNILGSSDAVDWAKILNDIRSRTPKTVRITGLRSKKGDFKIYLEGLALSYKAVDMFVEMLNKSQCLNSVSVMETERDNDLDGLVRYSINCLITKVEKNS